MDDYHVNLDVFNGPLDLLLYLIRREEVDIYDIPIARITEQYVHHVEVLKQVDADLAGQFMVLAATLLELKTRMMLPTPTAEDGAEEGLDADPRADLVRQLLEYKTFKDAADDLAASAAAQARKFPRRPAMPEVDPAEVDLEDVQIWDLLDAFGRLMEQIGQGTTAHEIIYDDTPVELHEADIMDRLEREGPLEFKRIFTGRSNRGELVGLFLALLELVRQRLVLISQRGNFDTIRLKINPNPPVKDEESDEAGTYTSDRPSKDDGDPDEEDDDDGNGQDQPARL